MYHDVDCLVVGLVDVISVGGGGGGSSPGLKPTLDYGGGEVGQPLAAAKCQELLHQIDGILVTVPYIVLYCIVWAS